jgi:hypothetical protein
VPIGHAPGEADQAPLASADGLPRDIAASFVSRAMRPQSTLLR